MAQATSGRGAQDLREQPRATGDPRGDEQRTTDAERDVENYRDEYDAKEPRRRQEAADQRSYR